MVFGIRYWVVGRLKVTAKILVAVLLTWGILGLVVVMLPVLMPIGLVMILWVMLHGQRERAGKVLEWLYWDVWRKHIYTLRGFGVFLMCVGAYDLLYSCLGVTPGDMEQAVTIGVIGVLSIVSGIMIVLQARMDQPSPKRTPLAPLKGGNCWNCNGTGIDASGEACKICW